MFATGLSSQPSSLLQPATGKCIACCACQVLLSQTRHQVHTSTRRGQSCEREAAPSMAPRSLPVTCLTLALVMEHPPATLGFHLAPRQANRPKSRLRARPPSSEPPRDASRRAVPAPKRRPPADIDASTLESALLNMNLAGTKAPKQKQVGSNAAADAVCSADVSHDGVLAEVLRQIARGDVFQAIATVAAAPAELATAGRGGSSGGKGDSVARDGFTAVLKACAGRGLWREAKDVLVRHMPAAGVEAAAADWLLAIDACAGAGGSERVILHLHDMRARGVEIDRAVYTAAVRTCARSGETGRTLFLMKDAARRGMGLLPADTAAAMRTLTKQSAGWSQALAVYDVFLELAAGRAQAKSKLETSSDVTNLMGDAASDDLSGPFLGQGWQLRLLSEVTPGWEDVCQAALEACTKGEQWERALEVLNVLRAGGGGAELSREAYDKAIEVCGNGCAWDMVLLLVAEMRSDEIPTISASFETALKACAATGSWAWARSLLSSVSTDGVEKVSLNATHYLEALRACAAVMGKPGGSQAQAAADAALELLQDLREARWLTGQQGQDAYVWAMKACVAAEDAWSALALLESVQDDGVRRSMALRTAAMQACSGAGEWRAALSILEDLLAEGIQPGREAYDAAMAACAKGGVVDLALELLDRILVEHPSDEPTITAGYHGAIAACAECGLWEEAISLLQRMRKDPLAVVTTKEYNAAIGACCRAQQSVAALTLLGDMSLEGGRERCDGSATDEGGVQPDETSYGFVMRAFGREGRWRTVMDLLGSMRDEAGLTPSVATYNVVVEALAKAGEWQRSLGMLEKMKLEGTRPTEFTYTVCMSACEKNGQWEQTLSLLSDMREQEDLVPDSYVFSTVMMACSKAGRLDDVVGTLQEMRDMPEGKGPNLVNYNIAIGSCARARDWTRMLEELDRMQWEDIHPEESTFLVPLDICGRSGELPMALALLARMRKCNVKPGVVAYGAAVAAACRAGDAASAALLLDEMEAAGHPPNEVTYGVAALACRDGANADAAVDLLRRRQEQGLPPDLLILSFAVQACSKAGDLARGLELIAEMRRVGLVPDSSFYTGLIAGMEASFEQGS